MTKDVLIVKKRTMLLRLAPLAAAGVAVATLTIPASQAAIKPGDVVINGVLIHGYIGRVSMYYERHDEPPMSEQENAAWRECKAHLGANAGQLQSVKRFSADFNPKSNGGQGSWTMGFACSAAQNP